MMGAWNDILMLRDLLSEEETIVWDSAAKFCQEQLYPKVKDAFRNESVDKEIVPLMGQANLLGPTIQGYGCAGVNYVCYGLIAHELEKVDSAYRSTFSVQSSLSMTAIHNFGNDAQKQKYLPKLASGELTACFGLTEPNSGSDPSSMSTHAKQTANGWLLNGNKMWISNSPIADVMVVWAKDEGGIVRGFIVEREDKNVQTPAIEGKFSLRASVTGEIVLQDCEIPHDRVLEGKSGLGAPFACLNMARYSIAWGAMGAAYTCWNKAREYVLERQQFGRPLAANQLIQRKLADMQTEIALGTHAAYRLGQLIDQKKMQHEMISLLKRNNSGKALAIAREARDMLGGNGVSDEFEVIRHMLNLESVNTYEGTHDVHALILGRMQTGISSFS